MNADHMRHKAVDLNHAAGIAAFLMLGLPTLARIVGLDWVEHAYRQIFQVAITGLVVAVLGMFAAMILAAFLSGVR